MKIEKAQEKAEKLLGTKGFAIFDTDDRTYLIGRELNGELLIYGNSDISWEDALDRAKGMLDNEGS